MSLSCLQATDRERDARRRSRDKEDEEAASSICEDVEDDPTMKRRPTKESEELKK